MQRVAVTGANRGIGLEFARQLLARGAHVFAACRQPGRALQLTELAATHPGRLTIVPLDLRQERSISGFARETAALTPALDLLINNAGVLVSGERFGTLAAKTFIDSFATNAVGPLLVAQSLAGLLARGESPRIANLSSNLGSLAATATFRTPSYALSKAALNMVTRLLAAELTTVTVVSIHPGWVQTEMGGERATLAPRDSVAGMLRRIDTLARGDSGCFFDHAGAAMAW